MSLFNVFDIASSAIAAQAERLNAVASNIANADSATTPDGTTYRAKHVLFQAMPPESGSGPSGGPSGVQVMGVVEDTSPPRKIYDPKHPLADPEGYVKMPNVNIVEEMVNMMSASRSYQSNIEVMNTAKTLLLKALTIGQ
jgi:flagellar basal-body rod protein FlgC